ncbi:P-II family nitrogen regulator [Porphyrobacter algicida]|uniref:Nitrogen regulatory protein P-II n=1 Tax=Qipengyuania algicida TaxID=1836209 RepID=A0A845AGT6_9SPHN|nr:P-II family nitrogen regulator [Qipengyuania algicida]MXP29440.1 P-II family nitrogen regulator [Qipengyuania algicida]
MKNDTNSELQLHRRRKIEVVVHAEDRELVEDILRAAGIAGWSIIRDVSGMGHSGFHEGKSIFNDKTGLVMFLGVGSNKAINEAAVGLSHLFEQNAGVTFLSDVEVIRSDYFSSRDTDEIV